MWDSIHAALPLVQNYLPNVFKNSSSFSLPLTTVNNSVIYPFSWLFAPTYLVVILILHNLVPSLGSRRFIGSLVVYLLQGIPICLGLTGFSLCNATNQLLGLFKLYDPDKIINKDYIFNYLIFIFNSLTHNDFHDNFVQAGIYNQSAI